MFMIQNRFTSISSKTHSSIRNLCKLNDHTQMLKRVPIFDGSNIETVRERSISAQSSDRCWLIYLHFRKSHIHGLVAPIFEHRPKTKFLLTKQKYWIPVFAGYLLGLRSAFYIIMWYIFSTWSKIVDISMKCGKREHESNLR